MRLLEPLRKKTKSGVDVILRSAGPQDAPALLEYGLMATSEPDCMVTLPEEFQKISVEDEIQFIQKLEHEPSSICIVAERQGQIIGMIDFHGKHQRQRVAHTGIFGMAIYPAYRGDGVGALLIQALLDWAQAHPSLRKIGLAVFSTNEKAIKLYKKMGFVEEGRRVKEIQLRDGVFIDDIIMYKWLEK